MAKLTKAVRKLFNRADEAATPQSPSESAKIADAALFAWGGQKSTGTLKPDTSINPQHRDEIVDAGPKFANLTLFQRLQLLNQRRAERRRQKQTTQSAREVERRQRLLERKLSTVDQDQLDQRRAIKARNRALILSGQVVPQGHNAGAAFTSLVPLDQLTYEFQSGHFDRKPEKQRGWQLFMSPSRQSDFWCLHSQVGLDIDPTVQFGKRVELRATSTSRISIGADVVVADRCIIQAGELVVIGRDAKIGPCCLIMDGNHHGIGCDPEIMEPVSIGELSTIGECSVVLSGAVVAKGQVVPPFSVVTGRGIILAPEQQMDARLISSDYERELKYRLAYVEPAQALPLAGGEEGFAKRRGLATVTGAGVVDLRSARACGALGNIMVSKEGTNFYRRPWGAPLFVATKTHTVLIGAQTFIHHSTQLHATGGSVHVGACSIISWRVAMLTKAEGFRDGDIVVEDQCWISANAILLPGTRIGRGSVVGAGSIVHGIFPPWSVIAGHPAEVKATMTPFEGPHGHPLDGPHGKGEENEG